jgi:Transposase
VEAYDGPQFVGMDLYRRRSVLVRMTLDGRRLDTARIASSPAELRREIVKAGQCPEVVLEATYGWYWAAGTLAQAGAEVHLAHPLGVEAFTCRQVKNDVKDAADLAGLLRMGRLAEAWAAPPEIRELRELTRYRQKLVRARTSAKGQIHAVLAKLGVPVTCSDIFGVWGSAWLDGLALPRPYAGKVASLRKLAGELAGEITLLDTVIADLLERHEGYRGYPGAARHRPGAGRGHHRGDRRHPPLPRRGPAVLMGGADPAPPRIRPQGNPRAHHQAGVPAAALGGGGGHPAPARRAHPRCQGPHHRPPRQRGPQHRQDRCGASPAHGRLLRDARWAGQVTG